MANPGSRAVLRRQSNPCDRDTIKEYVFFGVTPATDTRVEVFNTRAFLVFLFFFKKKILITHFVWHASWKPVITAFRQSLCARKKNLLVLRTWHENQLIATIIILSKSRTPGKTTLLDFRRSIFHFWCSKNWLDLKIINIRSINGIGYNQGRIQGGAKGAISPPPLAKKKERGERGRNEERKKNSQFE